MAIIDELKIWITSTPVLRVVFSILRKLRPVAIFGKTVVVTKYKDVTEVLAREEEFTVHEIDGYRMDAMGNPFVLGMDASLEAARDRDILRQVIKREDLSVVREIIRKIGNELIEAAAPAGRIDVVNGYARLASVRLVAQYFGVPADEQAMMRWQRAIFNDAFVNLSNDPVIHAAAMTAAGEIIPYMNNLIIQRKRQTEPREDNVLNRLIAKQEDNPWLDDTAVRRNISCILGVVENTSKVVTHVIDQLLKRPKEFEIAVSAARNNDMDTIRKYSFEALRFNPHNPVILRYCKNGAVIGAGTRHERMVPPRSTIYAATLSAMFDPDVVTNPGDFDPERNVDYLHFGHGPHLCTGRYINGVTVPELVAGLLRLNNLHRTAGRAGHIIYDQLVFPNSLVLEFNLPGT